MDHWFSHPPPEWNNVIYWLSFNWFLGSVGSDVPDLTLTGSWIGTTPLPPPSLIRKIVDSGDLRSDIWTGPLGWLQIPWARPHIKFYTYYFFLPTGNDYLTVITISRVGNKNCRTCLAAFWRHDPRIVRIYHTNLNIDTTQFDFWLYFLASWDYLITNSCNHDHPPWRYRSQQG